MSARQVPKLTAEQAAIVGMFTGVLCGPFTDLHAKAEKLAGHPVWTHQLGEKEFVASLKEKVKPEFLAICALGTELPNGSAS